MKTKPFSGPEAIISFGLGIGTIGVITLLPGFTQPLPVNLSLLGTAALIVAVGTWVKKSR